MDKNTKQIIISEAARLFVKTGFDGTSISQIAQAVGIAPSSIFSHFNTKEEIFTHVVNDIILDIQDKAFQFKENCSLLEFIDSYVNGIEETMKKFNELFRGENSLTNYFAFILQICDRYEAVKEKIQAQVKKAYQYWEKYIQNAKDSGEINEGIDVQFTAQLFQYIFYGKAYMSAIDVVELDLKEMKKLFLKYYNTLI